MSVTTCPSPQELSSLILGKLPREQAEALYAHVDDCADCQAKVETLDLDSDTLLEKLRRKNGEQIPYFEEASCQRAVELVMAVGREPSFSAREVAPAPAAPALQQIREYEILAELGHGGMGTVYKALHTRLKRVVALKVLPTERLRDAGAVSRFEREMEAVGKLDHPHIVRATDAGEHADTHYLVMEYIDGPNLSQLIKQTGPLPVADACELVRQAAVGLQHAHEHGLVHRDIKPGNLLLCETGQLKVLDLGLALLQSPRADAEELTSTGQLMGTLDYMAPEQARNTHQVDIRADIYSLGITLFKLLTGRAPFEGDKHQSPFEKMLAHTQEPLPPLTAERDDVPAELLAVFARMTAKDPHERFATPAEVAEALAPFCAGHDLPALLRQTAGTITFEFQRPQQSTASQLSSALSDTFVPSGDIAAMSAATVRAVETTYRRPSRTRRLTTLGLLGGILLAGIILIIRDRDGNEKARIAIEAGTQLEITDDTETGSPNQAVPQPAVANPSTAKWQPNAEQQAFFDHVAKLPAEEQVEAVREKLVEVNPGFDGKVDHWIVRTTEGRKINRLQFLTDQVTEIWPVRAVIDLERLECLGSVGQRGRLVDISPLSGMELTLLRCARNPVADLTPLAGMPLTELNCGHTRIADVVPLKGMSLNWLVLEGSEVSDLRPLKGMPLTGLLASHTNISDLSPLASMPLRLLLCNDSLVKDLSPLKGTPLEQIHCSDSHLDTNRNVLREMGTLKTINGKPAEKVLAIPKAIQRASKLNAPTNFQRIIDDGDPGYADTSKDNTKGWQPGRDDEAKTGGYGGDYRINHAGALTARWTFDELPAGKYAVFATWPEHPSAAEKCVYLVDAGDGANHQVAVSQQQRPDDEQAAACAWERLGTFEVTRGKLIVELDARVSTGPNAIADAVRIVGVE